MLIRGGLASRESMWILVSGPGIVNPELCELGSAGPSHQGRRLNGPDYSGRILLIGGALMHRVPVRARAPELARFINFSSIISGFVTCSI